MEKPTQQRIAEIIGISQGHLSRVFNSGIVGRRTCERLANILGGKWTNYAAMRPAELERVVREGISAIIKRAD